MFLTLIRVALMMIQEGWLCRESPTDGVYILAEPPDLGVLSAVHVGDLHSVSYWQIFCPFNVLSIVQYQKRVALAKNIPTNKTQVSVNPNPHCFKTLTNVTAVE
jgi:hypothetical protein